MKKTSTKIVSGLLVLTMLLPLLTMEAMASEKEKKKWWADEIWDTETLISLGAKPPFYNTVSEKYEISTPEQLLFLSGAWKTEDSNGDGKADAPRDGYYVLTNDLDMAPLMAAIGRRITEDSGEESKGFMIPISANKDENKEKTDGWFQGEFDGGYHVISNLCIYRRDNKYAGLIGYLGSKTNSTPAVRNLGLLDVTVQGKKSVGGIVAVNYGTVENCFVTGSVKGKSTTGGLVGKCKGVVRNCLAYTDVKGNELVGGLVGGNESGGIVENCYVGGSVTLGDGKASGGGVSGVFEGADCLQHIASVVHKISGDSGVTDVNRLIGTMESESGVNVTDNYVWEGCVLNGNTSLDHPLHAVAEQISAEELQSRSLYEKNMKWDFNHTWGWMGEDKNGYPVPAGFIKNSNAPQLVEKIREDLVLKQPVLLLDNPNVYFVEKGEQPQISARLLLPKGAHADSVQIFYSRKDDSNQNALDMTASEDGYQIELPLNQPGNYVYYVQAKVGDKILTVPSDIQQPLPLLLDDGIVDYAPKELVCQVGETYSQVGFNWITDKAVTDSCIWYREQGDDIWQKVKGESELHYLAKGWEEVQSHWGTVNGLLANTTYEYYVGGLYQGQEYCSAIHTFTTLPDSDPFTFMMYSDVHATDNESCEPLVATLEKFVNRLPVQPDFLLNTGDIVDSGYKSNQWTAFFDSTEKYMTNQLNILLPGNHENAGDPLYKQYGARTSLPNEIEYGPLEGTGWCVIGDACFVFVNSDPYSGEEGADIEADRERYFAEQTEWARQVYEKADCTWRIMCSHIGTYIVNFKTPSDYPYVIDMCDELQVDLYLNGHDHEYIRTTAKNNVVQPLGHGTTYMTCSSMGEKLDSFDPNSAGGHFAVVHKDGSENSQQIFGMITVDESGIHVTSYQRGEEENWSKYDIIDQYDITTSLTKGPRPAAKPVKPTVIPIETGKTAEPAAVTYTVQSGDCLYVIARQFYGNGSQWQHIYKANCDSIQNPSIIYVGQKIQIPEL